MNGRRRQTTSRPRSRVPLDVTTRLLVQSRRRCCLCAFLRQDFSEKKIQIAHISRNRSDSKYENIVVFSYAYIGASPSGVHMLLCNHWTGGTGVFVSVLLLAFDRDRSLEADGSQFGTRDRVLLKTLGRLGLGDRYEGNVTYEDGMLVIGPDLGWFGRGQEAARKIPIE